MSSALALVPRRSSLIVWIALVAMAVGMRATVIAMASSPNPAGAAALTLVRPVAPTLLAGILVFLLAQALLATQARYAQPLYARFLGLLVASTVLVWFINAAGVVVIFSSDPSPFMARYGSVLVGSASAILVFPFAVRMVATAVGADEPRLGGTVKFLCGEGRWAFLWCAVCAMLFPALMVFTFEILGRGNAANALPGNLLQSTITATGSLLRFLLAIVVARQAMPTAQRQAEVFA